jgi:ERCC4-type nuclease
MIRIVVDYREKQLIKLLNVFNKEYDFKLTIEVENLDIGDVIIKRGDEELLILERKTLKDLESSLKDGRYSEQSYRLNGINTHNHNIVYLIEGNIRMWDQNKYTRMPAKTLYVAMFCLNYYKGFSVMKTHDTTETAEYLLRIADKIKREKKKTAYYSDVSNNGIKYSSNKYCDVVSKVKKENITPENIGEIILSQIPGVSSVTSKAVMEQYDSLFKLLEALKENPKALDNITLKLKNSERRISSKSVRNIVQYLLYQKSNIIEISTE